MSELQSPSQVLLEWQALNVYPHARSARWYLVGGIFVLIGAAYGLFDGSWLTTLLALLIGGMYFLTRNEKPKKITIRITTIGLQVEERVIPWNAMKEFWILLGKDFVELHFAPAKTLQAEITVLIRDPETDPSTAIDPGIVRSVLLSFLPERSGMQERILDTTARLLKL